MNANDCPLCGSSSFDYCFSERGFDLVACRVCDLHYIQPYPENVQDRVEHYDYENLKILDTERHYRSEQLFLDRHYTVIREKIDGAKSVLDVGCGCGHLLEQLGTDNRALIRVGIELNSDRAVFARKNARCEVFQVPVENFESYIKFDVITMINVLSHIRDFDALFRKLRALTSENGKIIIKTGELARNVKKHDLFDWGIPDHLHFCGFSTLEHIARKFTWRIEEHIRVPQSAEFFSETYFRSPGRSKLRNLIKRAIARTPFGVEALSYLYDLHSGRRVYSSLSVLSKIA